MADLVPGGDGLVIHKQRVWDDDNDKPVVPSWARWDCTHILTGKRANPLPLVSKEAAQAFAVETTEAGVPWTTKGEVDWSRYEKKVWAVWNSINTRFTSPPKPSTESAST